MANEELPPPTFVRVIREVEEMREALRRLEFDVIQMMREIGVTWEAIGDEFGVSRQAARQRFTQPRKRRS